MKRILTLATVVAAFIVGSTTSSPAQPPCSVGNLKPREYHIGRYCDVNNVRIFAPVKGYVRVPRGTRVIYR